MIERDLARETLETMLGHGGDFAQIYAERSVATLLRLDGGRLEETATGIDGGAGLSLQEGDRVLYANGNRLDREALVLMASRLAGSVRAEALPAAPQEDPAAPRPRTQPFAERPLPLVSPVIVPPRSVPAERKVEILKRAESAARGHDPRVQQVTAYYRDVEQTILVADSEGVWASEVRQYITLYVTAVAREGAEMRTGSESRSETRGFEFFDLNLPEDVGREAARLAVQQLAASPAPAGSFTVVLSSRAGGTMVHEACGHGLEADFIMKGLSAYAGRQGQQVASPLITVVDDGTVPNLRGSAAIDDEGSPTTCAVLIEKGILKGFLHSRKTARALGAKLTGNGRRESYRHLPLPRMRNTMILPGESDPDQILAGVADGLFVCRMGGGEVDVATGNFVFHCSEAYRIRNGRIAEPIRDATLIGNGPEVLREIDRVGRDLGYGVGTCGKEGQGVPVADAQPTLRIPRITVGGVAS